jgi:hypothetical protein
VKWRTTCNSETAGNMGGAARLKCAGTAAFPAARGGNCVPAPRPGLLSSNISGSLACKSLTFFPSSE